MVGQAVKVKRDKVETCMKCPICNKLLKEATTISLCLHTFCRKCICQKLSDEEEDCCPVCNIDLGCLPEEKLRPDHNLQDIRAKIFPLKRRKVEAPEVLPPAPRQPKKKERLLSSLVVSAPKVSMQTGTTGRRTKALTRRAANSRNNSSVVFEEPNNKKKETTEDAAGGLSSQDTNNKLNKRNESFPDEPSNERKPSADMESGTDSKDGKVDLWTPLNCLVEAANRTKLLKQSSPLAHESNSNGTKSSRPNLHGNSHSKLEHPSGPTYNPGIKAKSEVLDNHEGHRFIPKAKGKDVAVKVKLQEDKKEGIRLIPKPGAVKRKRVRGANVKKAAASELVGPSAQILLDASAGKRDMRNYPVWFSLVASEDPRGEVSLPQIPARYLMIKDGNIPVSIIQKYIVSKLHLTNESEVEIICRGQPVVPTLQLYHLVDLWFRTAAASKRVTASVGASAKDFVMVLSYCRKVQHPC